LFVLILIISYSPVKTESNNAAEKGDTKIINLGFTQTDGKKSETAFLPNSLLLQTAESLTQSAQTANQATHSDALINLATENENQKVNTEMEVKTTALSGEEEMNVAEEKNESDSDREVEKKRERFEKVRERR